MVMVMAQGYGYQGRNVPPEQRDVLMSGYVGMPPGIVRSSFELFERLNGRTVDYRRAPVDTDKQDNLRAHLLAQLAREQLR